MAGPFFDDLERGQVFDTAPPVTLSAGLDAAHRAVVGNRLWLCTDEPLGRAVTGGVLASPALVWDVAIGHSSLVTRRVLANLFYRGVVFHTAPRIGDTVRTRTEIVALKQNRSTPSGIAALRITMTDQRDVTVLDFWRCAMLPLSARDVHTGHADDLADVGAAPAPTTMAALSSGWELTAYRAVAPGPRFTDLVAGQRFPVTDGDVVSAAPELARLTGNIAAVHHDRFAGHGNRLVYGAHTIDLALLQATRELPGLVTVVAWHSCDHTGPVHEGDTLYSEVTVENLEPLSDGGLAHLRSIVTARDDDGEREVLDWRFVALFA